MSIYITWPIGPHESDIWYGTALGVGLSDSMSEKFGRMRISVRAGSVYGAYSESPEAQQTRRMCLLGCRVSLNEAGDTVVTSSLPTLSKPVVFKPCGESKWRAVFFSAMERACASYDSLQGGLALASLPGTFLKPTLCNVSLAANKHRPVLVLQPVVVSGLEQRDRPVGPDEEDGWGDVEYTDPEAPVVGACGGRGEGGGSDTADGAAAGSAASSSTTTTTNSSQSPPSSPAAKTAPGAAAAATAASSASSPPPSTPKSPSKPPGKRLGGVGSLMVDAVQLCGKVYPARDASGVQEKPVFLKVDPDTALIEGLSGCAVQLTNVRTIFRAQTAFGLLAYKGQGAWTNLTLRPLDLEDDEDAMLLTSPPPPPPTTLLNSATTMIFGASSTAAKAASGSSPSILELPELAPVLEPILLLESMREVLALAKGPGGEEEGEEEDKEQKPRVADNDLD